MRIKIFPTKFGSGSDNWNKVFEKDSSPLFLEDICLNRTIMFKNMANYCFIVPILPGGIELMRKWNK